MQAKTSPSLKCDKKILRKFSSDYVVRIISCNIMLLILLATFLRFSHFATKTTSKEEIDPVSGNTVKVVVETPVTFEYVVTTLLVLPALYALYIIVEFNLHEEHFGKFFPFLKNPISKGVYLIMLDLMINDV